MFYGFVASSVASIADFYDALVSVLWDVFVAFVGILVNLAVDLVVVMYL